MTDNRWLNDRRLLIDSQNKNILGQQRVSDEDLKQQRFKIATFVMQCHDAGFDVVTMIQQLMAGAVWLGDQASISREQLATAVHMIKFPDGVQLTHVSGIVKP